MTLKSIVDAIPLLDRWLAGGFGLGVGLSAVGFQLTPSQATVALQTIIGIGGFIGATLLSTLTNPSMRFGILGIGIGIVPAIGGVVLSALTIYGVGKAGGGS